MWDPSERGGTGYSASGGRLGLGEMRAARLCTRARGTRMTSIEFAEHSKRLRAAHYCAEAKRFRYMAEAEPLRSVRRHLQAIASEYEHMAAACAKLAKPSLRHPEKRLPLG